MAFGNFWRGGGRERFGSERDQDRNRDRWRTTGSDWQENERDRWRDNEQRSGAWDRDRDEYSGHEGGGRENQYGGSGYGGGRQGYGGERYGGERYSSQREGYGSEPGRWGREERESDYSGMRSGGSEYDYRGGGSSYGTAGSYGEGSRGESRYGQRGFSGYGGYGSESYGSSQGYSTQGMHRGRGPRNYRRSDDRIREDVCDCLTEDPRIDASSIEVAVTEGEVVLTGTVFQRDDKRRAEDIVERIYGVKDVRNNLRVSSEQSGERAQAQGTQGQQGSQQAQQGSQQGQQGQTGQSSRH